MVSLSNVDAFKLIQAAWHCPQHWHTCKAYDSYGQVNAMAIQITIAKYKQSWE
jgi:hypothetical protein